MFGVSISPIRSFLDLLLQQAQQKQAKLAKSSIIYSLTRSTPFFALNTGLVMISLGPLYHLVLTQCQNYTTSDISSRLLSSFGTSILITIPVTPLRLVMTLKNCPEWQDMKFRELVRTLYLKHGWKALTLGTNNKIIQSAIEIYLYNTLKQKMNGLSG
jgi:hypothetical protein